MKIDLCQADNSRFLGVNHPCKWQFPSHFVNYLLYSLSYQDYGITFYGQYGLLLRSSFHNSGDIAQIHNFLCLKKRLKEIFISNIRCTHEVCTQMYSWGASAPLSQTFVTVIEPFTALKPLSVGALEQKENKKIKRNKPGQN